MVKERKRGEETGTGTVLAALAEGRRLGYARGGGGRGTQSPLPPRENKIARKIFGGGVGQDPYHISKAPQRFLQMSACDDIVLLFIYNTGDGAPWVRSGVGGHADAVCAAAHGGCPLFVRPFGSRRAISTNSSIVAC